MAAPIRFLSGRQQQQKIGIEGSTEDTKVLEVVGRAGIGTTSFDPTVQLEIRGDAIVEGTTTVGKLEITGTGDVPASITVETANVTGVSTFGGAVDVNAGLDVDGQADLDEVVVAGVATFSNAVDINSTLDVDGDTQLDDLNVAGVATFSSAINATDIIKGYEYTAAPFGSTVTLAVTVASKDSTHRYNGTGSSNAYVIDGIQSPFLTLTPGRTYRFTNNNTGSHPFRFYLEADKTTQYDTNVNFQDTYTEITITDETPTVLHYQCSSHQYMGNAIQTNANVVNTNYPATIRSTLNVTGVSTFPQLDVSTGGLDVDGLTNLDEVVVAGVSTFTGNIVAVSAEFSGNVTIAGTLTAEDKTNIDSLGIVTARTGVRVDAGGLIVTSGVSTFTDSVDIDNGVGVVGGLTADSLTISGVTTGINAAGISSFVRIDVDGQADLDELVVAGVATFQGAVNFDVNSEVNIGTGVTILGDNLHVTGIVSALKFIGDGSGITNLPGINTIGSSNLTDVNVSGTTTTVQLRVSGVGTAEKLFVSTGGFEVDGQSDLDELVVAGVSTFNANTNVVGDLSVTGDIGASGIITATGINLVAGSGLDVGAIGVLTALSVDVSTGGIDIDGQATLDEVVVAGVATFSALADVNNRLDVAGGANIDQLNVAGIASFTQLDVSTGGIDVDGQATLDELVVAGVSTFTGTVKIDGALDIGVAGVDVEGLTNLDELIVAGVSTFSSTINGNLTGDVTGTASNASGATGDFSIADKIVHTGDTDTAIRFPAANTFSVETAGSERLRVRNNGVVAIGTDESTTINFSAAQTQIFGTVGDRALSLMYTQANASGPQLNFAKGRDLDNSASTAVSSGDLLGSLHFAGADGSDFNSVGAEIVVKVDGTPGSNDMPGRIEFKTTSDGASTTTERLRISADGTCLFSGAVDINAGLDVDGQTDLDELQVAGVSTFSAKAVFNTAYPSIDADNEIQVGTAIQLGKAGVVTATSFVGSGANLTGVGTQGINIQARSIVIAGVSTFNDNVRILAGGLDVTGVVTATTFVGALTGTASNASGATGDFSIADKIVHTGDTNTALRFPAADTFTVETSGNERIRVSAAGTVSIGSAGRTDWDNSTNVGCQFQIEGLTQPTSRMSITRNSNDAFDGGIILGKSRGTSDGSDTIVQDGDGLGFISFQGTDGTTMLEGAKIDAIVQSSVASDDMPTDLVFYTNNDTTTTAERLRITSTGNVGIGLTNPSAKLHTIGDVMIQGTGGTGEQTLFIGKSALYLPNSRGVAVAADQNSSADHDMVLKTSTGSSGLVERVRITSGGNVNFLGSLVNVNATGVSSFVQLDVSTGGLDVDGQTDLDELQVAGISTFNGNVSIGSSVLFGDNNKAMFGAGDDLQIYHDGTDSYVDNSTGDLILRSTGDDVIIRATDDVIIQNGGSDNAIICNNDGNVELYFNTAKRFETTTDGADFSGTGGVKLPVGSTAQRPGSPTAGDLRYNSDDGAFEGYTDSWGSIGGGTPEVDTNVSSTSAVGVGSFATASFRSAEVIAQIVQIDEYQVGKYLMIHDGTTVTVIEQAAVSTGDSMIGSFDGAINGSNAELRVNMVTSGIATVTTKISTVTV